MALDAKCLLRLAVFVAGTWVAGGRAHAQMAPAQDPFNHPPAQRKSPLSPGPDEPPDPFEQRNQANLRKAQEVERHKRMVEDAEKLSALAEEIKTAVNKTSRDEFSMDVLRKLAQMDKLTKDIRERMRN